MKAKKNSTSKKVVSSNHHEKNAHAVLSLMVVLLAFSMLGVFLAKGNDIVFSGSFNTFFILVTLGLCLLLSLLFLAAPHKK